MAWKAYALFLLLSGCFAIGQAQNVSTCYICQEDDAVCQDPVNIAILPAVRCPELNYGLRSTPIQDNGLSAQIRNIMQTDVAPRSGDTTDAYQCIKVAVTMNSTGTNSISQGVLRTCVIKSPTIDSVCEYLTDTVTSNYTITSCDTCDADKCNGSASISTIVGVVFLSLAGLLFK